MFFAPVFKKLSDAFRVNFKILVLKFKALHGQAPDYISGLILPYTSARRLRSAGQNMLMVPRTCYKTWGDISFKPVVPHLWNELLLSLHSLDSVETFKKQPKRSAIMYFCVGLLMLFLCKTLCDFGLWKVLYEYSLLVPVCLVVVTLYCEHKIIWACKEHILTQIREIFRSKNGSDCSSINCQWIRLLQWAREVLSNETHWRSVRLGAIIDFDERRLLIGQLFFVDIYIFMVNMAQNVMVRLTGMSPTLERNPLPLH